MPVSTLNMGGVDEEGGKSKGSGSHVRTTHDPRNGFRVDGMRRKEDRRHQEGHVLTRRPGVMTVVIVGMKVDATAAVGQAEHDPGNPYEKPGCEGVEENVGEVIRPWIEA